MVRSVGRRAVVAIVATLVAACGGGGGGDPPPPAAGNPPANPPSSVPPPSALSYPSPQNYTAGTAIPPLPPSVSGAVQTYGVAPPLPAGLALDPASGEITGTPTVASAGAAYVITATNAGGATTFSLALTVMAAPVLTSISLASNTEVLIADGHSSPTLSKSFTDQFGDTLAPNNVPHELLVDGTPYPSATFITDTPGTYGLVVRSGSLQSNTVSLTARPNTIYPTITIPIVFHIAHFGEAVGSGANISAAEVDETLATINGGFANEAGSTDPNAVDTNVRFRLALLDPSGVPLLEPGIDRFDARPYDDGAGSSLPHDAPNDGMLGPNEDWKMQGQTYWNPHWYVNVWFTRGNLGGAGVAASPRMFADTPLAGLDTVPVSCMTSQQPGCEPWSEDFPRLFVQVEFANSGTTIHELGHALGLLHPQSIGTCGPGDHVSDTFNYLSDAPGKPECPGTLGLRESTTFMDYQGLFNTFTYEQRERIQLVLRNGRWLKDLQFSTR